jgi:hypothetical protein
LHGIEFGLYRLTVYEGSSEEYICFTTPECASAIDFYLSQREMWGEKLKPDSPLIRKEFDRRDPFAIHYGPVYYAGIVSDALKFVTQKKEQLDTL